MKLKIATLALAVAAFVATPALSAENDTMPKSGADSKNAPHNSTTNDSQSNQAKDKKSQ